MRAELYKSEILLETEGPAEKHFVSKLFTYKKKPTIKTNEIHRQDGTTLKHQFMDPLEIKVTVYMRLCDYDRRIQMAIVPEEEPTKKEE